jgi:choline dehydrogenase
MMNSYEFMQVLLDYVASDQVGARDILTSVSAAGLASGLSVATVQQALTAGETQTLNQTKAMRAYDYIFIGSGASGSIVAGELSKTGADVLVVEPCGEESGTAISNPSVWFYNVGDPLHWTLPIAPVPQLNNRQFNMALGRVLGGGSSVNAIVWTDRAAI